MVDALWVLVGVFIGTPIGFIISGLLTAGKFASAENEIQDLRTQRTLLKEEIFRLGKRAKPRPRKRRPYKKRQ
jgi:hypothetical protein|tara:strand:+ start:130 stop:348 length:219 start_codon:yes stop_codon:yes gene_type:complete